MKSGGKDRQMPKDRSVWKVRELSKTGAFGRGGERDREQMEAGGVSRGQELAQ